MFTITPILIAILLSTLALATQSPPQDSTTPTVTTQPTTLQISKRKTDWRPRPITILTSDSACYLPDLWAPSTITTISTSTTWISVLWLGHNYIPETSLPVVASATHSNTDNPTPPLQTAHATATPTTFEVEVVKRKTDRRPRPITISTFDRPCYVPDPRTLSWVTTTSTTTVSSTPKYIILIPETSLANEVFASMAASGTPSRHSDWVRTSSQSPDLTPAPSTSMI